MIFLVLYYYITFIILLLWIILILELLLLEWFWQHCCCWCKWFHLEAPGIMCWTADYIFHILIHCFPELLSSYLDQVAVYADRSFLHESTGSAFIYDGLAFSYRLLNFNSIFTAELYAFYRACLFVRYQPRQYHLICTDSLCALHNLSSYSCTHPIMN